ncbi:MAG: redoxin domain-containing protein [Chitinophagales bacterium]|nr:redoxin domain-containing protein [Chitinophagales bacterium]MDW8419246.1 redoxin domain-containing protein [Chitinophagales bacterium]
MALPVGTPAPAFTLISSDKKEVSLNDYKGKILVIHFFPAAFTGVCTQQLCSSRDELSFYNQLGADVVGVSVDMPFSLAVFKEQNGINFPLLSDFNKKMIRDYDMYMADFVFGMQGVAKRGVIVVDRSGVVAYSEETANPGVQVNFDALKNAISKL